MAMVRLEENTCTPNLAHDIIKMTPKTGNRMRRFPLFPEPIYVERRLTQYNLEFTLNNFTQNVLDVEACRPYLLRNKACGRHTGCGIDFQEINLLISLFTT